MTRSHLGAAIVAVLLTAGCAKRSPRDAAAPAPREIDSPAPAGSAEPWLASAGDHVYLSWLMRQGDDVVFAYATLEQGKWLAPRTIATGPGLFANWADFPSLVPMQDGAFAAHWLERHAGSDHAYDVRVVRSTDGITWSAPRLPHRDGTASEHGFVSMVPGDDGGGTCIWLDGREYAGREEGAPGAQMQLRACDWNGKGEMGDEVVIDPRVCDCCQTAAVRTAGGVLVAYRDRSDDEVRDISLVRHDASGWSAPYALAHDGWQITGCPVNGPALAADGARVAAAWFTMAGGGAQVLAALSSDGGVTFSKPVRIDEGGAAGRAGVVVLPNGDALVTWVGADIKGLGEIRARRVRADLGLDPSFRVSATSAERASGFPRVTRSGAGLFFAWTEASEPSQVHVATLDVPASWGAKPAP